MVRPPLQVDGLQGRSYYKQRELIFRDNQQKKRSLSELETSQLKIFRDSAGVSCFFISKYFTYRHVKSLDT